MIRQFQNNLRKKQSIDEVRKYEVGVIGSVVRGALGVAGILGGVNWCKALDLFTDGSESVMREGCVGGVVRGTLGFAGILGCVNWRKALSLVIDGSDIVVSEVHLRKGVSEGCVGGDGIVEILLNRTDPDC